MFESIACIFQVCCQNPPEMHWKMLCTKQSSTKRFKWFHLSLNEWMNGESIHANYDALKKGSYKFEDDV